RAIERDAGFENRHRGRPGRCIGGSRSGRPKFNLWTIDLFYQRCDLLPTESTDAALNANRSLTLKAFHTTPVCGTNHSRLCTIRLPEFGSSTGVLSMSSRDFIAID